MNKTDYIHLVLSLILRCLRSWNTVKHKTPLPQSTAFTNPLRLAPEQTTTPPLTRRQPPSTPEMLRTFTADFTVLNQKFGHVDEAGAGIFLYRKKSDQSEVQIRGIAIPG